MFSRIEKYTKLMGKNKIYTTPFICLTLEEAYELYENGIAVQYKKEPNSFINENLILIKENLEERR